MLKIIQIQFNPQVGEVDNNFSKVANLLGKAKDATLVILPELANTGYNFTDREQALGFGSTVLNSRYVEMLIEMARKQSQYIVTGFHEKDEEELFNTSLFIPGGMAHHGTKRG